MHAPVTLYLASMTVDGWEKSHFFFFSCQYFELWGKNGVSAILRQWCSCSLLSSVWYLVLIMFIVENADSQQYVEPNMVRMCSITLFRTGKSPFPRKWQGHNYQPALSKPRFLAVQSNDATFAHLKIFLASSGNSFVIKKGVLYDQQHFPPRTKSSNWVLKLSICFCMKLAW